MLKHLNMASIKERNFFDHQKRYLAPAIVCLYRMRARQHFYLSVYLMDHLQMEVMVGQIAQGILPSMTHMESLI